MWGDLDRVRIGRRGIGRWWGSFESFAHGGKFQIRRCEARRIEETTEHEM
jgi:hypothetical protein